ncbi:hypothetical protein [Thermococcus sp.]
MLGYILINRADGMYVPGEINTIIQTGAFYQNFDKYPLVSILYASIFIITGIEYTRHLLLIPIVFSIFFSFLLFSILGDVSQRSKFIIPISIALSLVYYFSYYHLTVHPSFYSFVLSVFLVYLILTKKIRDFMSLKIMTLVVILSLPFSHPYYVTAGIIFVGSILIYECYSISSQPKTEDRKKAMTHLIYISIALILFLMWIIKNPATYSSLSQIILAIKHAYMEPALFEGASKVSHLNMWEMLLFLFGYLGRYSLLGMLVLILSILNFRRLKPIIQANLKLIYASLVLIAIQLIMLMTPLFGHYPERYINLSYFPIAFSIITIVLLGYSLEVLSTKKSLKLLNSIIVTGIVITSIFALYSLPEISFRPNSGVTINELSSVAFIFENKGKDIPIFSPYDQIAFRYCEYTDLKNNKQCKYRNIHYLFIKIFPDHHFGYTEYGRFTILAPAKSAYILLTDFTMQSYFYIPPYERANRFNIHDYRHMNTDPDLNRIYSGLNVREYLYFSN